LSRLEQLLLRQINIAGNPMKKFTLNLLALLAALASTGALAQLTLPATSTPRLPAAPPPGLYVAVLDGAINLSNKGGTTTFAAGQFGYLPAGAGGLPAPIPRTPPLVFTPPATFMVPSANNGAATGNRAAPIDCVVR
jgi:hypothetical protein